MRLSNEIRNEVLQAAEEKLIVPRVEKLKEELAMIAQQIADNYYPPKTREWIEAAPDGGVYTRGSVYLSINGDTVKHVLFDQTGRRTPRSISISLKRPMAILAKDHYELSELELKGNHLKQAKQIIKNLDALEKEREKQQSILRTALWACNTRKQLVDNYPDLVPYLPQMIQQTKALTVTNDQIKKVLAA